MFVLLFYVLKYATTIIHVIQLHFSFFEFFLEGLHDTIPELHNTLHAIISIIDFSRIAGQVCMNFNYSNMHSFKKCFSKVFEKLRSVDRKLKLDEMKICGGQRLGIPLET